MDPWKPPGDSQRIPHQGHSSSTFLVQATTPTSITSAQQTYAQQGHSSSTFLAQVATPTSVGSTQQTYAQQQAISAYTSNHAYESQHSIIPQSTVWVSCPQGGQQGDMSSFTDLSEGASIGGVTSGFATSLSQYDGQHGVYATSSSNNSQQLKGVGLFQGSTSGAGQDGGSFGDGLSSVDASAVYGLEPVEFVPGGAAVGFGGAKSIDHGSSSSHGYSMKSDQYPAGSNANSSEYISAEREQYGKGHGDYAGGYSQRNQARRYPDAVGIGQSRQKDLLVQQQQVLQAQQLRSSAALRHDQLLRQQQVLQAQQLQSGTALRQSLPHIASDREMRLTEYVTGRSNATHSGSRNYAAPVRDALGSSYGVSMVDANPGLFAFRTGSDSYHGQRPDSVVGHTEGRNLRGSMYRQGPLNTAYGGVGLPPGRDYNAAKRAGGFDNDDRGGGRNLLRHEYERRVDDFSAEHDQKRVCDWQQLQRDSEHLRECKQEREDEIERQCNERREHIRLKRIERKLEKKKRKHELRRQNSSRKVYNFRPLPGRETRLAGISFPHIELPSPPINEIRREYICKINSHSLVEAERGFLSVSNRYKKLHVAPDFSKLVTYWMEEPDLSLGKPISFERNAIEVEDKTNSEKPSLKLFGKAAGTRKAPRGSTVWNSKVILMSGIGEDGLADLVSERSPIDKIVHMHAVIKFAVFRDDRAVFAAGGRWDKVLDGGDPAKDEGALVRTAIRIMKETADLDLTYCQKWKRFVELHYRRAGEDGLPGYTEISVFFIPDLSTCLPSFERWQIQWNEQKQAKLEREGLEAASKEKNQKVNVKNASVDENCEANEEISEKDGKKNNEESEAAEKHMGKSEEPPSYPGFFLSAKQGNGLKIRPMSISLEGLLDYNEMDTDESTFELSLFAEVFKEMLQYQLGSCILASLEALRERVGGNKRKRQKRAQDDKPEKEKLADIVSKQNQSKFSDKPTVDENADDKSAKVEIAEENTLKIDESAPSNDTLPTNCSTLVVDSSSDKEAVKDMQIADVEMKDALEPKGQAQEEKMEDLKVEKVEKQANVAKKTVIDKGLLKAYCYFDENRAGYIKADDLRRLLHALGKFISNKDVKKLVGCALHESKRPQEGRIIYQHLVEHVIDV